MSKYVYLLTASADHGSGDWDGISEVHARATSAIESLRSFLVRNEIDEDAARYGETKDKGYIGNDPDPDTLDGVEVEYGISKMAVIA